MSISLLSELDLISSTISCSNSTTCWPGVIGGGIATLLATNNDSLSRVAD